MASISETGHAKNVANFQDLISFVEGYGNSYNPSNGNLKLSSLNNLYANALSTLSDVTEKNTIYNNFINDRIASFNGLKVLSTRLVSALDATQASDETVKNAKVYNRKLQGKRASTSTPTSADPNTPAPATISVSQQSYDQLTAHFGSLISILSFEPSYMPNETELTISSLNAKRADMQQKNSNVSSAYAAISNSRIGRNDVIYGEKTGLVDIAAEVKLYVKSVFGASSPQYLQVRGIEFKKAKK